MKEEKNYKDSLERLKEIIHHIENEEPDVDELANLVKEATQLVAICKKKLRKTEDELRQSLDDL